MLLTVFQDVFDVLHLLTHLIFYTMRYLLEICYTHEETEAQKA